MHPDPNATERLARAGSVGDAIELEITPEAPRMPVPQRAAPRRAQTKAEMMAELDAIGRALDPEWDAKMAEGRRRGDEEREEAAEFFGESIGSFLPGVGEALDVAVLTAADSTPLEKTIAGASLGASVLTGTLAPNIGGAARRFLRTLKNCRCFAAGTKVLTVEGPVAIEELEPGDLVWAMDVATGEQDWRAVEAVWEVPAGPMMWLGLEGSGGAFEELHVSREHPLWRATAGWTLTGALVPGQEVWTRGGWARVIGTHRGQPVAVYYTLTVDEWETFFVGELGTWAHNAKKCAEGVRKVAGGGTSGNQLATGGGHPRVVQRRGSSHRRNCRSYSPRAENRRNGWRKVAPAEGARAGAATQAHPRGGGTWGC